jgi:hypothetical protein
MTDSGAIAARCGGWVRGGEQLRDARVRQADHADLAVASTQSWAATVSTMS